ncbi:MAG: hypothetical protein JKY32_08260 [Rhizobiales bacterium]|nr:hypothetical protein [Hyphomicrobiales bacterium]
MGAVDFGERVLSVLGKLYRAGQGDTVPQIKRKRCRQPIAEAPWRWAVTCRDLRLEAGAALCKNTTIDPVEIAALQIGSTPGRRTIYTTP